MKLKNILDFDLSNIKKKKAKKGRAVRNVVLGSVFLVGGVVTGILCAPKSGKKTRKSLEKEFTEVVKSIKATVDQQTDNVKSSAKDTFQEVSDIVNAAQVKAKDVQKDIEGGYRKVAKDINKSSKNISNDLKGE